MKKYFLVVLGIMALVSCTKKTENVAELRTIESELVSLDMKEIVGYLASDEIEGRNTGTEGIDKAATYIENQFKAVGVKPYYESFRDHFKVDSLDAFNVVGWVEGTDEKLKNEFIVVGAHYDHVGRRAKPVEGDSIANGANDNATGTATVLKLAEHFGQRKRNKRSLIFALFSAEEMGLLGSKHLAERMKNDSLNLYTMVNFEMTGVPFTDDRSYVALLTGYDLSNMAEKINAYVGEEFIGKSEVAVKYSLFKRSDNYPFFNFFGIPAQTVGTCDLTNFDFYHHVDDEADKMDYEHMQVVVDKMIPALEGMSNSATQEISMQGDE